MTKCSWKKSFPSPQKAMATVYGKAGLRPYLCKECGRYRLTSHATLPARKFAQMDTRRRL